MSLRYLSLSGLLALSLTAQTPANPQSGQGQTENQNQNRRSGSDRTDTTSRTDQQDRQSGSQSSRDKSHAGSTASGSSSLSSADRTFVMKAVQGGKMEVEIAEMGVQNASSEAVKNFAQRLVTDHTNANQELTQLASQKGVQVSESSMNKDKNKFSKMQGAAFDRAFMQHMIKDHQKDIAMFEKESNSGSDPDVKAFAAKTLPTLREHLEQARSVANSLGSGSTSRMDKDKSTTGGASDRDHSQSSLDPSGKKGKQQ
jgi:putative membrane protein